MSESTSNYEQTNSLIIHWKRWLPLMAICVLIAILSLWDRQLKKTDIQGYVLKDAEWTIGADHIPAAWASLYTTDKWAALIAEGGSPIWSPLIEQRKRLGIRLSPNRWQSWLGTGATLSGVGEEWVLCTRPGVMMRILDVSNGSFQQYGPYHYRWKEGFLFISRSSEALQQTQDETAWETIPKSGDTQAISLQAKTPFAIATTIRTVDTWPIAGQLPERVGNSIIFAEITPFSVIPVLRDYVATVDSSNSFRGTVEIVEHEIDSLR